ncbi:hypothetical protein [Caldimonas brevitalea]|uniref:Uncharacterized protein n=1 Tax=Caldimonas brevitalea TaxID=413882 RepID=A0A0G3BKC9_9BURK|nr:hypothetical protein [Caldimonas brevitalea]AKJ29832.1 hypothetical protein AAW51_3141 [Caldimonas brevitalea]
MSKTAPDAPGDVHWTHMIQQCSGETATPQRKVRTSASARTPPLPTIQGPPPEREMLRAQLPTVERLLRSRRVDLLSLRDLGQYLALEWIEWYGGTLRLTDVGRNVRDQVREYAPPVESES